MARSKTDPSRFTAFVEEKMPSLLLIWLLISVLGPHQELYKIFFHGIVIPAILVLLLSDRHRIQWLDPVLLLAISLAVYSSINSFIVGIGPVGDHIRALRWAVETLFCLLSFFIWLPAVLEKPAWWGRVFMGLSLAGAAGGFLLFTAGLVQGRLHGLGALHNPIQASSILIVYLAIGYFLSFVHKPASDTKTTWLAIAATLAVTLFVLMSQSRAPIVAMFVLLAYMGGKTLVHSGRLAGGLLMFGGAALIAGLVAIIYGFDQYHGLLMLRGGSHRFEIWQGYIMYPPDSWIFGFGAGTDPAQLEVAKHFWEPARTPITHAHNLWLGTLVENGIIGFGFLFAIAFLLAKSVFTVLSTRQERIGLMMILLIVFLLTLTGSHTLIISAKAIWLFGWLPLLFVWLYSRRPSEGPSS